MSKLSIYNELKLILGDVYESVEVRSKWTCFWVLVTQISANVFVFGILGGVGYFIWTLLHVRDAVSDSQVTIYMRLLFADDDKYGIEF